MTRIIAVAALVAGVGCGCIPTTTPRSFPPQAQPAQPTQHIMLVGDSLTMQFGPAFKVMAYPNRVTMTYYPGTNPVAVRWAQWVQDSVEPDVVVLQDYSGSCCDMGGFTSEQYVAAVQEIADIAHTKGARFVVLEGAHPDLSGVTGIDATYPMVLADDADGVHYTPAGAQAQARHLVELLRVGIV